MVVSKLRKEYRVAKREPGFAAAFRALFRRSYEKVVAVDDIDFHIAAGERVGFLGPNGAGKTTTLKMLAGLLHPTSGSCTVSGFVPRERRTAFLESVTLVLGQKQQLLWDLPPVDTFELNRAIYQIPRKDFDARVAELVTLLDLGDLVNKPTRELSLGERMKCELVAALLHGPRVLFLDEPTIGLDVTMQATVRDFVRAYNERHGATLVLTSHYMEDVLALCPRILVIDKGALSYDGSVEALVSRVRPDKRITARLAKPVERADLERFGVIIAHEPTRAVISVPQAELAERAQAMLASLPLLDFEVASAPLEEVLSELFARTRAARESA
ncbi:MAG: ATP-binding cassette domain-containing protein [Sandaracinaceae bacterium]|nr:ATP-binding cassette domain-containing protein [Sandaracinaceae bacterium]